jgi:transposase
MAGIPVILVNPAYTSQRCHECGHTERANRRSQAEFECRICSYTNHADLNASLNIAWAAVNPPIVASDLGESPTSVTSHRVYPSGR